MFKKPFSVNLSHKVSGVDRKKLRRTLEKVIPDITPEQLDAVLPSKAGELEIIKLAAPSRRVVYTLDNLPILIDASGKNDLLPTVFALWRVPQLLPAVHLKHAAVSKFLLRGADLMLPGVDSSEGLPSFESGALLAVCVRGNPLPFAVGTALCSSSEALSRREGKGRLVEVAQVYGDHLWADMGGHAVPNEGFLASAVVPLGHSEADLEMHADEAYGDEDDCHAGDDADVAPRTPDSASPAIAVAAADSSGAADGAPPAIAATDTSGNHASTANGEAAAAPPPTVAAPPPAAASAPPEDMDRLLELALLQALHKSVKDKEHLPLNSSVLWSQHMLPNRPPGSTLDIKRSSHKKIKAFFQAFGGKKGLLQLKDDKHSGETIITGINREHPTYTEFRIYKLLPSPDAASTANTGDAPAAGSSSGGATADRPMSPAAATSVPFTSAPSELTIEEVYKPGRELRPVFEAVGQPSDGLYSASEAADVAFGYVKHAGLEVDAPDERTLVLDALLCDALFKGLIKKGELFPTHLPKASLREAFFRRMLQQTRVSRGGTTTVLKGPLPPVLVSVEKRQGSKSVTRVVGLEPYLVEPAAVAADCQRKFATATSVNKLPGKHQGHEVVVQGNVVEKLPDHLMSSYGIPRRCFQVKTL